MQKSLLRQLKRSLGIADEAALITLLSSMQAAAETADPALRGVLLGFGDLLARVDGSYEQYERDLELRTRSLEISSAELSGSNQQLRQELTRRQEALSALRAALNDLLPGGDEITAADAPAEENIATLSRRIAALVAESEHGRRELANQKFALDQHAIVSITDPAGNIIYANDRFCEISGYRREELLGSNHRIVNSGHHPADFFRSLWETISHGQVWHGEMCNRTKNGTPYWVNATIVPLLDETGCPEQYIAIRTDISDRKAMEKQLSEQLHLVEELIEAIPLPLYLKDLDGRYLRVNRAFELFFDVRRERFIGRTLHDLLTPEDALIHAEKDAEIFQQGGVQTYEAEVHSRDGSRHDTIYRKAVLTRPDGSVSGLLGAIIDITERKLAEAALRQAKEVAEAANRAKSEFLANMSHEIRTPMNGVIGMTELALDTVLTEEQREYLGIVKSSAESLLAIINDILDFSKIEAGKLNVESIAFDLHRVIAETLKTLALRAHEKNLELVGEIKPGVARHVVGDPSRIRQVLINLIGNAIKFTEQGEIAVTVAASGPEDGTMANVLFSVRDTGIGIPKDKQEQIFDAFTQEDTSTTRRYGGTGLGLSISRQLVRLMNGEIWLQSEPGIGSTFHISLRLPIDTQPPLAPPQPVELTGRRILIVDANETNRRVLAGMLAGWGVQSHALASAAAALDLLRQSGPNFDCIILDAQMPEMDGYELARCLTAEYPALPPMLMLSSAAMRGDSQRCQAVGIRGFFPKPISAEELLAALVRIFDSVRAPHPLPVLNRHALREEQGMTILLVEDHPTNQRLATGLLEKWGHRVTVAGDGRQAIDIFARQRFDLILMDMQMPVMGGLEATRRIREQEAQVGLRRTPIIAMTAAAMNDDRDACLTAGMDDYLTKPIRTRDLLEKLLTWNPRGAQKSIPAPTFDYAAALASADRETVEIIAGVFLDTWQRDLERLRNSREDSDAAQVERTAHSFKGTLASFHAEPAIRLAKEIESQARQGNLENLQGQIDDLEDELKTLAVHLTLVVRQDSG